MTKEFTATQKKAINLKLDMVSYTQGRQAAGRWRDGSGAGDTACVVFTREGAGDGDWRKLGPRTVISPRSTARLPDALRTLCCCSAPAAWSNAIAIVEGMHLIRIAMAGYDEQGRPCPP
jgi:hypothetical protein